MFYLSEQQQQIIAMVSSFTEEHIWPNALAWDEKEYFPICQFQPFESASQQIYLLLLKKLGES